MKLYVYMIIQRAIVVDNRMKFSPSTLTLHRSLFIFVLYRHAVESVDGKDSREEEPVIIKEHIFVISDDVTHDYDSVHKAQELIDKYLTMKSRCQSLKYINLPMTVLHGINPGTV